MLQHSVRGRDGRVPNATVLGPLDKSRLHENLDISSSYDRNNKHNSSVGQECACLVSSGFWGLTYPPVCGPWGLTNPPVCGPWGLTYPQYVALGVSRIPQYVALGVSRIPNVALGVSRIQYVANRASSVAGCLGFQGRSYPLNGEGAKSSSRWRIPCAVCQAGSPGFHRGSRFIIEA